MANLSDIARLAGVSLATVSRVVNGTARVAPEKRERILKAMRETGFQPVESAKAFYKQPSSLIGYVIPSLHNLFLNEIGTALEEAAQEKGYQVVVCDSGREPKREWDYIRLLSEMNADGIVITANNDEMEEEIRRCRLPVVVVDRKAGREYEASVSSDNSQRSIWWTAAAKGWFTCGVLSFTAAGRCVFRGTWMCAENGIWSPAFWTAAMILKADSPALPIFWNAFPIPMGFFAPAI